MQSAVACHTELWSWPQPLHHFLYFPSQLQTVYGSHLRWGGDVYHHGVVVRALLVGAAGFSYTSEYVSDSRHRAVALKVILKGISLYLTLNNWVVR